VQIRTPQFARALIALAALFAPVGAHAQSGMIDCSPGGHPPDCRVQLKATDRSAIIVFRPLTPNLTEAPQYQIAPLGSGEPAVPATRGSTQIYTYAWKSDTVITETVRLLVQSKPTAAVPWQSDTIYLVPFQTPPLHVEIVSYAPYAGLKDTWLPMIVTPRFRRDDRSELKPEERVRFKAQAWAGGTVQPDSGMAEWDAVSRSCYGETRWKLGPATGTQQLRIEVGDDKRVERSHKNLRAFVREGPRVIGGIGFFNRYTKERSRFCPAKRSAVTDCHVLSEAATEDTFEVKFPIREDDEFRPFFGLEVPVILSRQPANRFAQFFARRVRLMGGTSFDEPSENVFVGATVSALAMPEYESSLVQLQAGWQFRSGGYFLGMSIDASSIVTAALKTLGGPF